MIRRKSGARSPTHRATAPEGTRAKWQLEKSPDAEWRRNSAQRPRRGPPRGQPRGPGAAEAGPASGRGTVVPAPRAPGRRRRITPALLQMFSVLAGGCSRRREKWHPREVSEGGKQIGVKQTDWHVYFEMQKITPRLASRGSP